MIPALSRGAAMASRRLGPAARGISTSMLPNITTGRAAGTAGVGGLAYLFNSVQSAANREVAQQAEDFSTRAIATVVFKVFGPMASMLLTGVGIGLLGRTAASSASSAYQRIRNLFMPRPPAIDN